MSTATEERCSAIVKGAGPAGLGAAIALAQEGFNVTVIEKRPQRPVGQGRQNMVAIRPEALHQLDLLGALPKIVAAGILTPITEAATTNEMDGSCFVWPLDTQARYPSSGDINSDNGSSETGAYVPPDQLDQQVPSSYITLGQLEDHLAAVAISKGVKFEYEKTVRLSTDGTAASYKATVVLSGNTIGRHGDEHRPSLIVCASGKNDTALSTELQFKKRIGNKLEDDILPVPGGRDLQLGANNEMESQTFCVFGVRTPAAQMGILKHVVRKHEEKATQPVVEIEMRHAEASHCLLQLPRGFQYDSPEKLQAYVLERVNQRLSTSFESVEEMREEESLVWGEPLIPVTVETAIAPKFVFGNNVVLVGDAGMSCSPSSGLGADVGLTHDVQAVRALGRVLSQEGASHSIEERQGVREKALDAFNLHKAKGAVMWSRGSRWFYITKAEADEIVRQSREQSS